MHHPRNTNFGTRIMRRMFMRCNNAIRGSIKFSKLSGTLCNSSMTAYSLIRKFAVYAVVRRRVEVLARPRQGQSSLKDESLSVKKEFVKKFVHQVYFSRLLSQRKSRVLLHQWASINHGQSITWMLGYPRYVVLFSRPDMKLIAWLAREAIRLPMERSLKQPKHLPIHHPPNLLLPLRSSDSVPVSLHPRFPQTATSRVRYILRISQILRRRHLVQSWFRSSGWRYQATRT